MATFKISKLLFKSMFKKPATLMYPVVAREWTPVTRGHVEMDVDACIACGICAKKCPANAITVDREARTWSIQRMQCIQCNSCVENCPKKCLTMAPKYTDPNTEKVTDTFQLPPAAPKAAPAAAPAEGAAPAADGLNCNTEVCVYCGLCAKTCPVSAITVDRAAKSWTVDKDTCLKCGACVDKCPKHCLTLTNE